MKKLMLAGLIILSSRSAFAQLTCQQLLSPLSTGETLPLLSINERSPELTKAPEFFTAFRPHGAVPAAQVVSPDQRYLVVNDFKSIHVIDLVQKKRIGIYSTPFNHHLKEVRFIGSTTLVVRPNFGDIVKINILDMMRPQLLSLGTVNGNLKPTLSMALTKSGSLVLASKNQVPASAKDESKTLKVIDLENFKVTATISTEKLEGQFRSVINSDKNELFYLSTSTNEKTGETTLTVADETQTVVRRVKIPFGFELFNEWNYSNSIVIQNGELQIYVKEEKGKSHAPEQARIAQRLGIAVVFGGDNRIVTRLFTVPL